MFAKSLFLVAASIAAATPYFPLNTRFIPEVVERQASACSGRTINLANALQNKAKLTNPFKFLDGSSVTSKADWECRRQEIAFLIQHYELGFKPPKPKTVTATRGLNIDITVRHANGKQFTFSPRLEKPNGAGPFPVLIYLTSGFFPTAIPAPSGIAKITLNTDDIAKQDGPWSRDSGNFYDMYTKNGVGALTAWAWGVSRIIDVVEDNALSWGLDKNRIGVTGCSRYGKGALVAGALDERIKLVIPQESGAGGNPCWRLLEEESGAQTAKKADDENVWFAQNFTDTIDLSGGVKLLPYDHHLLQSLVAPRGLLAIDESDNKWLGPSSSLGCTTAAQTVFQALGVKSNIRDSISAKHNHCSFPDSQNPELNLFVNKFLRGQSVSTDGTWLNPSGITFDKSKWIDWTTPTLT